MNNNTPSQIGPILEEIHRRLRNLDGVERKVHAEGGPDAALFLANARGQRDAYVWVLRQLDAGEPLEDDFETDDMTGNYFGELLGMAVECAHRLELAQMRRCIKLAIEEAADARLDLDSIDYTIAECETITGRSIVLDCEEEDLPTIEDVNCIRWSAQ